VTTSNDGKAARAEGFNKWTQHGCYGAAGRNDLKQQLEAGVWKGAVLIQILKVSLLKGSFCQVVFRNARAK